MKAAGMLCLSWRGCGVGSHAVPAELQLQLCMLKTAVCLDRPPVAGVALQALGDCMAVW